MKILGWITALAALVVLCTALPSRIIIGGLFDAQDEELEHVLQIAVDKLNSDEELLENSRVLASIEKLSSEDSFVATKQSCGLLQNGVAAIIGPRSELTSMHVQSICDDFEIPHIKSRWEYRLRRDQLSINMYPHPQVLTNAFLRLLEIWNWNDFFLVYEEDEAIIRMKDFLMEGEKRKWKIKMYKFPNAEKYRDVFWEIKEYNKTGRLKSNTLPQYNIVLDVPREHLFRVLKSAQQVGMVTEQQKYLITSLDLHTVKLNDFQFGKTNITGLRLVQEDTAEFKNLVREVNSRLARRWNATTHNTLKTEAALIYDSVRVLALGLKHMDAAKHISVFPPISCNLLNKGVDGTSLVNYMKNVELSTPGLSGMIEFDAEGYRSKIYLDVMYLTSNGLKKIGTILPENQVNITSPGTSDFQYYELENRHFKISTFANAPYIMLKDSIKEMTGNDRYEGFGIDLLDALAEKLHFTYEIHQVKDGNYGKFDNKTGEWNGMIKEVITGVADLAITDLTITSSRLEGVDFTLPFMQTGIGIVFKKPTQKVTSLFSFLMPFKGEVWLLIVIAYTYISLCLFLVGRLSPYEWDNLYPCRQNDMIEGNCFSLLNSMWWAIGSLLQQGSDVSPTASSTRALTSTWSFFRVIIISSYTANLAAFLTVTKFVTPFESAEDLAKQDKIKYGCVISGSTKTFFETSNIPTFKAMHKFMEKHKAEVYVQDNKQGIEKVKKGGYAFMMESTTIEYNTERECNLTQVGGLLDSKGYGIAVKKGDTKLRNWLSGGILQLQEGGMLYTLKEKWWKQKRGGGKCEDKASGIVTELGLGNVGGVILVMNLGMVLAAFTGTVEFFWFQRKLRSDQQESTCRLFWRQVIYAITCGSSSKPAPKFKDKDREGSVDTVNTGYRSFP